MNNHIIGKRVRTTKGRYNPLSFSEKLGILKNVGGLIISVLICYGGLCIIGMNCR